MPSIHPIFYELAFSIILSVAVSYLVPGGSAGWCMTGYWVMHAIFNRKG